MTKWINVKDRLPDVHEIVLVFDEDDGDIVFGCRRGELHRGEVNWELRGMYSYNYRTTMVTWWMPFPAQPIEVE